MTDRTCARRGCENTGPLTDIAGGMISPPESAAELPDGDVAEPILVCESCAEEYSDRVSQAGGLSPTEFVADEVDPTDH